MLLPALRVDAVRRIGAPACFALAALTALLPSHPSAPAAAAPRVPTGLVSTTAAVYADALTFVRPGDHVDLVAPPDSADAAAAPPTVVAQGVVVLRVRAPVDPQAQPRVAQVLIAAPRAVAVQIAAHQGTQILAAITAPP